MKRSNHINRTNRFDTKKQGRKKYRGLIMFTMLVATSLILSPQLRSSVFPAVDNSHEIQKAYYDKASNLMVEVNARVVRVYPDIEDTTTYQQFRIALENGHELMVMHDLGQAKRVPLQANSELRIRGEYDWSTRGGVIHWTYDDPDRQREGGWIELNENKYF